MDMNTNTRLGLRRSNFETTVRLVVNEMEELYILHAEVTPFQYIALPSIHAKSEADAIDKWKNQYTCDHPITARRAVDVHRCYGGERV